MLEAGGERERGVEKFPQAKNKAGCGFQGIAVRKGAPVLAFQDDENLRGLCPGRNFHDDTEPAATDSRLGENTAAMQFHDTTRDGETQTRS